MQRIPLLILAFFAAVALSGCATDPEPEHPRVRLGMSRDDVRFYFGEPLRREAAASGGEDWYYRSVSRNNSRVDGEVWHDASSGTDGATVSVSTGPGSKEECPIHFSAEGYVIEPLPEGKILGR